MNESSPERDHPGKSARNIRRVYYAVPGAICVLIVGLYAWIARPDRVEAGSLNAERNYYNLLVQGLRRGQISLSRAIPSSLAQSLNLNDPAASNPYWLMDQQLLDASYYRGRLYLYFGVTPALALFWPYAVFAGDYLLHAEAVVIFLSVGLLASVGLLGAVWRQGFAEVSFGALLAGVLALGLANFVPAILPRCDVYEVAISCGYALTMVTLLLLWRTLQATRWRSWWLAGASLAYGLAVGARPSLLFGAVILLVPVLCERQKAESRRQNSSFLNLPSPLAVWLGAIGPITIIGLGLMLYNYLRFYDPLEFGQRYQLPLSWHQQFSLHFVWPNFRVGFLEPARWSSRFPFVHEIAVPPLPRGSGGVFGAFGTLANIPLVWLALAAPLAWRSRFPGACSSVRWFVVAVALLFGACALTIVLHDSLCLRYELEFASTLALLSVVGIFSVERALASQPAWHRAARWGWGLLLAFSVSFNLLAMVQQASESYVCRSVISAHSGQQEKALAELQHALKLQPDNASAHSSLGVVLFQQGKMPEAIRRFEEAVRLQPGFAEAHYNLGSALLRLGRVPEAIQHLEWTLRLKPGYVEVYNYLGLALLQQGQLRKAIGCYEQALWLEPGYAEARKNLGMALFQMGEGLAARGQWAEAIRHYQRSLELKPDDVAAQNNLAWLLATCADGSVRNGARAVELAETANGLAGGKNPAILDTLAAAYAEAGRLGDAVRTAQKAVELTRGAGQTDQARQIENRLKSYQAGLPYHEGSAREQQ